MITLMVSRLSGRNQYMLAIMRLRKSGSAIRQGCLYCSSVPPVRCKRSRSHCAQKARAAPAPDRTARAAGSRACRRTRCSSAQARVQPLGQSCPTAVRPGRRARRTGRNTAGRAAPRRPAGARLYAVSVRSSSRSTSAIDCRDVVLRQLLAGEVGEVGALAQELDQRRPVVEAGHAHQVVDVVAVQAVGRRQQDEVRLALAHLVGRQDGRLRAVAPRLRG